MDLDTNELLAGVTVLELSQALAGPYCGQLLADLGARVIKIEKPTGDDARGMPPHFVGDTSSYFLSVNRGKESVAIDLKASGGPELVLSLLEDVDIVLESNRPGVLSRLGLAPDTMLERNPRLVVCSITGFGQDGPYRDRGAYDIVIQAASGGMSITGEPGGQPLRAGIPVGDMSAGMGAAFGILAALHRANATGQGCHLDVSMLDIQVSMLGYHMVNCMLTGAVPGPSGNGHGGAGALGAYPCSDDVVLLVAPMAESMWPRLCDAIGREDLVLNPEFDTRDKRAVNRDRLKAELGATFAQRASNDWIAMLDAAGIPVSPVNTLDRVAQDPQIQHRHMVQEMNVGDTPVRLVGNPIKVRGAGPGLRSAPPPELGHDSVAVLSERLRIAEDEIGRLIEAGVVVDGRREPTGEASVCLQPSETAPELPRNRS